MSTHTISWLEKVCIPSLKEYLSMGSCIYNNENNDNSTCEIISLKSAILNQHVIYQVQKRVLECVIRNHQLLSTLKQ